MIDYEAIERLARLRDSGVLTEEEFTSQKAKILSGGAPAEPADGDQEIYLGPRQCRKSPVGLLVGLVIFVILGLGIWTFVQKYRQSAAAQDVLQASSSTNDFEGDRPTGSTTATTTASAAPKTGFFPVSKKPRVGRCHMDDCSWFITKAREVIRANDEGSLIRLTLLGGLSANTDNVSPKDVKWDDRTYSVYVFCSKKLPAVLTENDGVYQVDVLDFVNGPPGALEASESIYESTCKLHNVAGWDPSDPPDIKITQPMDIFVQAQKVP